MRRRGVSIAECVLALTVVMGAAILLAQFLTAAAAHRRADEQRRLALAEVANRMEQAAVLPWEELTADRLERLPLSSAAASLPAATLTVQVTDEPGGVAARRVRIELSYVNAAGVRVDPLSLVSWRFRAREDLP